MSDSESIVREEAYTEYIAEDYSNIHGERILLLDAGGKIPNLVLMKLSAYLRANGNRVHMAYIPQKGHRYVVSYSMYDRVFISVIFKHDFDRTLETIAQLNRLGIKYHIGGVAWDWRDNDFNEVPPDMVILPYDVEHTMPDYTLYNTCSKHANRYFARDWGPHEKCPVKGCNHELTSIDFAMGYTTRGCIRNCSFCLHPDTLVLMSDLTTKKIKDVQIGDEVIGFKDVQLNSKRLQVFVKSRVTGKMTLHKMAYKITMEDGNSVICSGDHRWYTADRGWKYTTGSMGGEMQRPYLTTNNRIKSVGPLIYNDGQVSRDYMIGYIVGMFEGDGTQSDKVYEYPDRTCSRTYSRVAVCDKEIIERLSHYFNELGLPYHTRISYKGNEKHREATEIYSYTREVYESIKNWKENPGKSHEWKRGFVAGFYDAEGTKKFHGRLAVSNKDKNLIYRFDSIVKEFGFNTKIEKKDDNIYNCTILGGLTERVRFFNTFTPAVVSDSQIIGLAFQSSTKVKSIEPVGMMDLIDISTTSETYIANGLASHNCVVRPKEGYIHHHANIDEFLPEGWDKVILLDNNFFFGPKWREHVRFMMDNDIKVNFNQGLDMRIMNNEIAEVLTNLKLRNHTFRSNQVHFAFDHPSYEPMIRNGIELLMDHGFNARRLMFYVLVGFWTNYEQDIHRIKVLLEYDTDPYIMRYHKNDPILNAMSEWINGRHYSQQRSFVEFLKAYPRFVKATGKSLDELKLPANAYEEIQIGKLYRSVKS